MRQAYKELLKAARIARKYAYCPYSRFKVGAAVLTSRGNVYTGVNVENAAYGLTICAERAALYNAISHGERSFRALALVTDTKSCVWPCGGCRQAIFEFGKNIIVIAGTLKGHSRLKKISELLPCAFECKKKK